MLVALQLIATYPDAPEWTASQPLEDVGAKVVAKKSCNGAKDKSNITLAVGSTNMSNKYIIIYI